MVFALLLGAASIAFLTVALQMIWFGERRKRFAKRLDEALNAPVTFYRPCLTDEEIARMNGARWD